MINPVMATHLTQSDYVELGRRFVLLAQSDALFSEFSDCGGVDFAAKPKQCVKGYACGASCVSKSKSCANPLEGQAKTYAEWLQLQINAGSKLSKLQKQDAKDLGLKKSKKAPKPKAQPTAPDPAKISSFEQKTLVKKLDTKQDEALQEWESALEGIYKNEKLPQDIKDRAETAVSLAQMAHAYVKDEDMGGGFKDGYRAVVDKNGVTQAMALVTSSPGALYLDYLSTAPWNITGNDPRSSKGAGTAMMKALAEESIKRGFNGKIELGALPGAVTFYEKLGFVGPAYKMILNPEAAHKLLYGT